MVCYVLCQQVFIICSLYTIKFIPKEKTSANFFAPVGGSLPTSLPAHDFAAVSRKSPVLEVLHLQEVNLEFVVVDDFAACHCLAADAEVGKSDSFTSKTD